jgi:hypothetical protein
MRHSLIFVAAFLMVLPLVACSSGQQGSDKVASSDSLIDNAIDRALDNAKAKLATENLPVSDHGRHLPTAEISPQGDFLVAGKPVPLTSQQRAMVLAYRQQLVEVARQGITVGKQGATLGMHAASEALAEALSGKSEQQIRQQVKTQASGIRQAAAKICGELPALMESQKKLADALPAFKPYATMTQKDIDDCRMNAFDNDSD